MHARGGAAHQEEVSYVHDHRLDNRGGPEMGADGTQVIAGMHGAA